MPPLVGGMERLNWHMADELSRYADVWIIAPAGSSALRPERTRVTEVPLKPLWRFLVQSAAAAASISRKWKPDFILAGSGLTAPAAFLGSCIAPARTGTYLHGLDAALRHPVYRAIWHPAIRRMNVVIANSTPTSVLAKTIGVHPRRLSVVHPGVQEPLRSRTALELANFRNRHRLGTGRILLSIGRLTTRKGLKEFVRHSLPSIVQNFPDIILVVIGESPTDSLHAKVQSRETIQATADGLGIGNHLRFLGVITEPEELACAFESAALHIFPVRDVPEDPEGFGMVAIEAAAHGVPTVAFASGGIVESVAQQRSGHLVEPGDYQAFSQAAQELLQTSKPPESPCIEFASSFFWPNFGKKILQSCLPEQTSRRNN